MQMANLFWRVWRLVYSIVAKSTLVERIFKKNKVTVSNSGKKFQFEYFQCIRQFCGFELIQHNLCYTKNLGLRRHLFWENHTLTTQKIKFLKQKRTYINMYFINLYPCTWIIISDVNWKLGRQNFGLNNSKKMTNPRVQTLWTQ